MSTVHLHSLTATLDLLCMLFFKDYMESYHNAFRGVQERLRFIYVRVAGNVYQQKRLLCKQMEKQ